MEEIIKEINYINEQLLDLKTEGKIQKDIWDSINNYVYFVNSVNNGVRKEIYMPQYLVDEEILEDDELFDMELFTVFLTFMKYHLIILSSILKENEIKHVSSLNVLILVKISYINSTINKIQNIVEEHTEPEDE